MKFYYDHVFGNQSSKDLVYTLVSAEFNQDEWDYAFQNGWQPTHSFYGIQTSNLIWYQARQTRLVVKDYQLSKSTKRVLKDSKVTHKVSESISDLHSVYELYKKYCAYKNFSKKLDYLSVKQYFKYAQNSVYLQFFHNQQLIAITKISLWNSSPLTEFFWWNYDIPKLSVGRISSHLELELVKKKSYNFLYLGLGYNKDSQYKSDVKGFQWWTGRYWSADTDMYKKLCTSDDNISTIDELYEHQLKYLGSY